MKKIERPPPDVGGLMLFFATKTRADCGWVGEIGYGCVELVFLYPTSSVIRQQSGQFLVSSLKTLILGRSLDCQTVWKRGFLCWQSKTV